MKEASGLFLKYHSPIQAVKSNFEIHYFQIPTTQIKYLLDCIFLSQ